MAEPNKNNITDRVIRDMNEGVMVLDNSGKILMTNVRALNILGKAQEDLIDQKFAAVFFGDEQNDDFNQTVLNAIYEPEKVHSVVIAYYNREEKRYLNVITSGLTKDGHITGIIVMLSDITELVEVREHLKMMQQIEELNAELKKRNEFIRQAFGRYLSYEIVDKILDTPDGLSIGGNMSNITVMMSDLRGFTAMCEHMDPSDLIKMLNHYLDYMGKIIKELHGTVIEYVGDGILAIFGEPVKLENHAENAVRCAIMMQSKMSEINKWNEEHGYPRLKMGIGINTGDAVVGNIGSEHAVKYNVIGSCVNLCGRIESYTTEGQLFISPTTHEMIGCDMIIDNSFEVAPKGVKEPITIYSVKGLKEPYNISYEVETGEIIPLEKKEYVSLKVLDGKHISDKRETATVTGRSDTQVLFTTEAKLDVFDNIILSAAHDVYGKITKITDEGYIMTITGNN